MIPSHQSPKAPNMSHGHLDWRTTSGWSCITRPPQRHVSTHHSESSRPPRKDLPLYEVRKDRSPRYRHPVELIVPTPRSFSPPLDAYSMADDSHSMNSDPEKIRAQLPRFIRGGTDGRNPTRSISRDCSLLPMVAGRAGWHSGAGRRYLFERRIAVIVPPIHSLFVFK